MSLSPSMVIYSPRLLICLQEECTVGRERGHWNQTFPQSLQTLAWRYTKSQALSTLSSMVSATCCYFLPFLSIHKGTDTPGHLGCIISEDNTKEISEVLVCTWESSLPGYLQDHGTFGQGCILGSCDLRKLSLADEMYAHTYSMDNL